MPVFSRTSLVLWSLCAVVLVGGCGGEHTIDSYTCPRTAPARAPLDPEAVAAGFEHMLTAVLPEPADSPQPQATHAWFLKAVVTASQLEELRDAWGELLASLEFQADETARRLTWKLPPGWSEKAGDAMRAATLVAPLAGGAVEVSVSRLPISGTFQEFLVANVNRWLNQLQQGPLTADAIQRMVERREIAGVDGVVVELRGLMKSADPMAGHPPMGGTQGAADVVALPRTTPGGPLRYETPQGWEPGTMSQARLAAFTVADADGTAEVTVTAFPASPGSAMADPVANARRWAGQVGLTDVTDQALQKKMGEVEVDGSSGKRLELLGDEGDAAASGMVVVMVEREGNVFFFKLMGPRATVAAQREAFDAFVASVGFDK